jgi:hypothetical protein
LLIYSQHATAKKLDLEILIRIINDFRPHERFDLSKSISYIDIFLSFSTQIWFF